MSRQKRVDRNASDAFRKLRFSKTSTVREKIMNVLQAFSVSLVTIAAALPTLLINSAVAADQMVVVTLAGKFKPCGADNPGCEHILLNGDPASEPNQHVYRFAKGYVFPKHWHVSNENLEMVRGVIT